MTTKIVLRLLDAADGLIGWTAHEAAVHGDGALWSASPIVIVADRAGAAACVSLHWADVNVEVRVPCVLPSIAAGQRVTVFPTGERLITVGAPPVGLPPVTVTRSVVVGVGVGMIGAAGHA
jgi:hypothetical protein